MVQPEIDHNLPAAHGHAAVPNHPSYSPPTPVDAHDHRVASPPSSPVRMQSQARWPEGQETSRVPPTESAYRPHSALSTDRATGWCTDSFIAAYQTYCVSYPLGSRPQDQASPLESNEHYADASHQTIREPASLNHSTFNMFAGSTTSTSGSRVSHRPIAAYVVQPAISKSIARSALPAVDARIEHGPSHEMVGPVDDAHTHNPGNEVPSPPLEPPPASYLDMHPIPPRLSSYSELAPATAPTPPSAFVNQRRQSSAGALAAISHDATPFASAEVSLDVYPSHDVPGTYSSGPVYLVHPYVAQEVSVNDDKFARTVEGHFDDCELFAVDTTPSLHCEHSAEGWASTAVSEECARIIQECVNQNERLDAHISTVLQGLRRMSQQGRHATPASSL